MWALVFSCRTSPKRPWFDFWFRLSPAAGTLSSDPSILYFALLLMCRLWCRQSQFLFWCSSFGCWEFSSSWMDPESHLFCTLLEFAQHCLELFFWGCKQEHVVSKSHVCQAVVIVVAQENSHSFFFCQCGIYFSNAFCRTVLKSKLDNGSPCLVPFYISNMSHPSPVSTGPFWSL